MYCISISLFPWKIKDGHNLYYHGRNVYVNEINESWRIPSLLLFVLQVCVTSPSSCPTTPVCSTYGPPALLCWQDSSRGSRTSHVLYSLQTVVCTQLLHLCQQFIYGARRMDTFTTNVDQHLICAFLI